jgi:SEC-C motif-containing protein
MKNLDCPCGRNKSYKDCCALILKSIKKAETAEDLMRSRYVAFVKGNGTYLQKSHHPKTRPSKKEAIEIEEWAKSVAWVKLEVLNSTRGTLTDTEGTVEFNAYFHEGSRVSIIHEKSYFQKVSGLWKYKS